MLAHCLEQMGGGNHPELEILVFDNASTDGSADMVRSRFPRIRLLRSEENLGIEGYNRAVAVASGEVILVLDDDSYVEPDAIPLALERFSSDPTVGVVAFQVLLRDGRSVTAGWPAQVPSFWGCGAAVRRSLWDRLGGYDPDFFLYLNEVDLAIRVWDAGYQVVYEPSCRAHHLVDKQNRASGRLLYHSVRNVILFQLKNVPAHRWPRTMSADLLSYFSLALLARRPLAWLRGLWAGWRDRRLALARRRPVSEGVVDFYLRTAFMWKWPHRQWMEKRNLGTLNTNPRDV